MKYGKRSKFKTVLSSPFALLAALILFVILARATWNMYERASTSSLRLSRAEAELGKLKDRHAELSGKVAYLSTDQGVEAEIRTKYRAVKDGESVAVIIDDPKQTASVANASSTPSVGWWGRMLHWVGF